MFDPNVAPYPDLRDPRAMVAVPRGRRAAMDALWTLSARLTRLLVEAREPLIAQIKLAWWRDMLELLASDPGALPEGEPLLAELRASWAGQDGLDALVDAAEEFLLADGATAEHAAAAAFGGALFMLSDGPASCGARWGLLWGAVLQENALVAQHFFVAARNLPPPARVSFNGNRALFMLDRWAFRIAQCGGERNLRSEAMLLLRIGLFGR